MAPSVPVQQPNAHRRLQRRRDHD